MVFTVQAADADVAPPNNEVTYQLASGGYGHFSIDSQSGQIKVIQPLDKEGPRNQYPLLVTASDRGQPVLSNQQTVLIKVKRKV